MQEKKGNKLWQRLLPDLSEHLHSLKSGRDKSREQKVVVYIIDGLDAFKSRGPGGIHGKTWML